MERSAPHSAHTEHAPIGLPDSRAGFVSTRSKCPTDGEAVPSDRQSEDPFELRAALVRVHAEWLDHDQSLRELVHLMLQPLARVDEIRRERDEALRHASGLEQRCLALESRFEHKAMRMPRRFARLVRSLFRRAYSSAPPDVRTSGA